MAEICNRVKLLLLLLATHQIETRPDVVLAAVVEGNRTTWLWLLALESHSCILRWYTLSQAPFCHKRVALASCCCNAGLICLNMYFFKAIVGRGIHRSQFNLEKLLE